MSTADEPDRAAMVSAERCAAQVLEVVPQVMDALRQAMRRQVGGPLSIPQFRCLNHIARSPGASIGSVATFMGVTMPTASAMVDRLLKAEAISTRVSPEDRRRVELQLTPLGRAWLDEIRQQARVELTGLLQRCSGEDLRALQQGLAVLQHAFDVPA